MKMGPLMIDVEGIVLTDEDVKRIWVNPDCGLKTRGWPETIAALKTMVQAAKELRTEK